MISYEEALKIAKQLKPNLDGCTEYENGYAFSSSKDEGYEGGAGHSICVIEKSSGKAIPMNLFVINGTGKYIKEFDV